MRRNNIKRNSINTLYVIHKYDYISTYTKIFQCQADQLSITIKLTGRRYNPLTETGEKATTITLSIIQGDVTSINKYINKYADIEVVYDQ